MKIKKDLKTYFRFLHIVGLLVLFTSIFLEWYIFRVYNSDNKLIASWSYNILSEWSTVFSEDNVFNKLVKPDNISVPIVITVLFVTAVIGSGYCVLFKDLEQNEQIESLYPYAYVNFLMITLNFFYIFAFPVFYLLPNKLYFPFLWVKDKDMDVTYFYSIGPGYILQIIGFIMIFPYTIFYYKTIENFKSKEHSPEKYIKRYVQQVQEPLDLDKLIAKEELSLKFDDLTSEDFGEQENVIFNKRRKKKS